MGLTLLRGPGIQYLVFSVFILHDHAVLIQLINLQNSSLDFLSVSGIRLVDREPDVIILHQQDAVFGHLACGCYVSVLIDPEGCIRRNRVASRRNGLTQDIGNACLQAFNRMGFPGGIPLIGYGFCDLAAFTLDLLDDLDMRTLEFLSSDNIDLGYADPGLRVFNEDHGVAVFIGGAVCLCLHLVMRIHGEGNVCCQGMSFRRCHLAKRVFLAGKQAFDIMDAVFLTGPLVGDISILIQDLKLCAFQFFAIGDINLADADLCPGILDEDDGIALLIGS